MRYEKTGFDSIRESLGIEETLEEKILSNIYYQVSKDLIKYRIEHGLTQSELAQMLSVSQAMMSKYESGEHQFSVKRIVEIYCTLELEVENVFSEEALTAMYKNIKTLVEIEEVPAQKESSYGFFSKIMSQRITSKKAIVVEGWVM